MRRIICIMLIICLLPVPTQALNLFKTDYDKDKWEVETITFALPDTVPKSWYPLKAVSEYLPIDVDWDDVTREIVVYSHEMAEINTVIAERKYCVDNIPTSKLIIKDGVTYCSPEFLSTLLLKTDGNEPIYVRQYSGVYSTLTRTATLLDGSGNTSFPGAVTVGGKATMTYDATNECLNFAFA